MKLNNILSLLAIAIFAIFLFISLLSGQNKRVIRHAQEGFYHSVIVVDGRDTVAYDYMSAADYEFLSRTGSLR
jgi:hypothetical protein